MGYFTVEVKPTIPNVAAGQHAAFAQNDLLFDWYAFDVPKGTCRLYITPPTFFTKSAAPLDNKFPNII